MLWETIDEGWPIRSPELHKNPIILVVTEAWQQDKCKLLDLPLHSVSNQPTNYVGQQLCSYKPWETETIVGDGNCLFRCLSQIITGNQDEHLKIRSVIAKFIASNGATQLA